ncbi:MAG: flagellar biosynthetic protein FliO [Phycisphaerales bacterium]|nr:flagellar biosynthetic protein FliO [Phycisphaerales bacterium]
MSLIARCPSVLLAAVIALGSGPALGSQDAQTSPGTAAAAIEPAAAVPAAPVLPASTTTAWPQEPPPLPSVELPDYSAQLVRMLLVVGVLCTALVAALWFIKRKAATRPGDGRTMRLVDSLRLGPGRELVLLEAGRRRILIGVTPSSMTTLSADIDAPIATGSDAGWDALAAVRGGGAASTPTRPVEPLAQGAPPDRPEGDEEESFSSVFQAVPARRGGAAGAARRDPT